MAQPLQTSTGYVGQVCFVAPGGRFAKILHDSTAILTWAFAFDMPTGLKKGDRVRFDVREYMTKNQVRRKAVNIQIAASLAVAPPEIEKVVVSARKRKSAMPQPGPEALAKLANVEAPQKFHRI
jgi:hypothetical protein